MSKTVAIILAVSLAANVFLGGFFAGRVVGGQSTAQGVSVSPSPAQFQQPRGPRGAPMLGALGVAREDIPVEARQVLRAAMRGQRQERRRDRETEWRLRAELRAVLAQDPFDRAAAEEAMSAIVRHRQNRRVKGNVLLLDFLEALPADARRSILSRSAERFEENGERRGHVGGSDRDHRTGRFIRSKPLAKPQEPDEPHTEDINPENPRTEESRSEDAPPE